MWSYSYIVACNIYTKLLQVLILRIPIHEIASLSYINDDQEHLLFLKAGKDNDSLNV